MKKIILTVFVALGVFCCSPAQNQADRIQKQLSIFNEVMRTLDVNFVDTLNYEAITRAAINAMLAHTDPYTIYFPEEKSDIINQMTTGKYAGVGAIIAQIGDTVYIEYPYYGKPAYTAGLRAGDAILAIDGEKMVGKKNSEVSSRLRGKIGTPLKIQVKRVGHTRPITMTITRDEIHMPSVTYSALLDNGMGYILFSDFTENSSLEFKHHVEKMASEALGGLKGLIIDLRGNPGGIVGEAARILSYFIDEGTTVVVTKRRDEVIRTYKTQQPPVWRELPLVVLVDEESASASEIVAGTLQDLDRAVIIGERTYGKGLVQNVMTIEDGGDLKVTIAKYYIPSGRCIQALDYRKMTDDGKPYRTPDSLTNEFSTLHGRKVRDGGGIQPDVNIKDENEGGSLAYSLMQDQQFLFFANHYAAKHNSIAPLKDFEVTDDIMQELLNFLKQRDYKYTSVSAKYLEDMERALKFDGIADSCKAELDALSAKLNPSLEEAFKIDDYNIRNALAWELLNRYYPDAGPYAYSTKHDNVLLWAIELLNDPEQMKNILSTKQP